MINKETLEKFNLTFSSYEKAIERMLEHIKSDGSRGLEGPFMCLNEYYSYKQSGATDWTGHPGSGKSYMCLEYIISISFKYGKRFALYVPDMGDEVTVYEKLFKMITGYDFHSKYSNKIPVEVLYKKMTHIMYHFPVLIKKDRKIGIRPQDLWEFTAEYKDESGVKLDGCLGDSWKDFKHVYTGREDLYLDDVLSYRNEICEQEKIHIHTIAHASKTETDKNGRRRIPGPSDIKGGESWNANGKNIITVDYPDKSKTGVNLFINKVKPETVGKAGYVTNKIYLDLKKGRYFEFIDGEKSYAFEYNNKKENDGFQLPFSPEHIEPSPF